MANQYTSPLCLEGGNLFRQNVGKRSSKVLGQRGIRKHKETEGGKRNQHCKVTRRVIIV